MAIRSESTSANSPSGLPSQQVYGIAATCLLLGLFVGYFFLGKHAAPKVARSQPVANASRSSSYPGSHPKMTLEQMKKMADIQASGLLEKSKLDPKNAALLIQIAGVYESTHQFKDAASYFDKALEIDPKNVSGRTSMASCLYYSGDVDGALDQLNQSLKYNPKDATTLFNFGMIKYQGMKDPDGAIAAWQQLLKSNPHLDRKPVVEQIIAEAKASTESKAGTDRKN